MHSLRLLPDKEGDGQDGIIDLVLLGPPGKRSAYWHQFKVDAMVESVTCIGADERRRKPRHTYFESSQRLHVSRLRFPQHPSLDAEQLLKRVPEAGRQLMENEGLTPIFLRIRMRR